MKRYLLLLLVIAVIRQAMGQEKEDNQREVIRYRWDAAADLLWLVNKNERPPSVLVRLNRERDGRLSAWRLRLAGNYTIDITRQTSAVGGSMQVPATPGVNTDAWRYLTAFAAVGREWQRQFHQFQLFYGADLYFRYDRLRERIGWQQISLAPYRYRFFPVQVDTEVGISPLIGLKYFIHSRVSVGSEAHLNLGWQTSTFETNYRDNGITVDRYRQSYYQARLSPLALLYMGFHF